MRVLLVTNNPRWEGTEAQVASVSAAFRRHDEVALHAAVFRPGVLVEVLESLGIPVRLVPVRWQFDVRAVIRLGHLIKAWHIDVLHSHGYKANVIGALAARLTGIHLIARTIHGLPEPFRGLRGLKMGLYLWLDGIVGRHLTNAVIAVSEDVAAHARRLLPGVPVFKICNGIDPTTPPRATKAEAREALDLPRDAAIVGILGRLVPIKDHRSFLLAARQVAMEEPGTHFIIAGDGPLKNALEAQAKALQISERVHFRYMPGGGQTILDALDLLVFASRHEGIPYALLEALRSEVPVVATVVGGLAEALTNDHDALLVSPGDPNALAEAMIRLLRDSALAKELGERGRQTLKRRFSLEIMRDQMAEVYEYLDWLRTAGSLSVTSATEMV